MCCSWFYWGRGGEEGHFVFSIINIIIKRFGYLMELSVHNAPPDSKNTISFQSFFYNTCIYFNQYAACKHKCPKTIPVVTWK